MTNKNTELTKQSFKGAISSAELQILQAKMQLFAAESLLKAAKEAIKTAPGASDDKKKAINHAVG